jgi:hypothetical protein
VIIGMVIVASLLPVIEQDPYHLLEESSSIFGRSCCSLAEVALTSEWTE